MTATVTYCTILTTNYLPKAMTLADSLRRHENGAGLKVLFSDVARDEDLPDVEGVECVSTASLGLSAREVQQLAMIYELVELATAVKPLLLKHLLDTTEAAVYLDPDTYLTSPMVELLPELEASEGGILLTPHFLKPERPDAKMGESHMLAVGIFNLGFCAVDRRAIDFLDWWWGHLSLECLYEPLAGLFVDQKWVDIGSTLFAARSLRHTGYNVGVGNLPERPLAADADGYYNSSNGERLRLFHFHAFDSRHPEKLSMRFEHSSRDDLAEDSAIRALCAEYAEILSAHERSLPAPPPYPYANDSRGRHISRRLRRAYRQELPTRGHELPSPFVAAEAVAYDEWRRSAWKSVSKSFVGDTAKTARWLLPEEYDRVRKRFPKLAGRMSSKFSGGDGMWG
ncbi:hypothetical protein [Aeromicrobium ginsengisoli]|uniref:Glycosyl transferase n=1 Tax=Aeromicrobium ginsengisoli TaxID=363867 RepID=A0A5M4FCG0_9ACTN|nr:hypothetical protein [Aeromicrobium ginsengisoli]KAA1396088.1 hypothetical protein ESP70_018375 [Aeromicrobium ginsengisoli]